ncbi:MAG: hypothetical protein MJ100_08950 [Ruminococcus sp.]|nr:hypothetical protein [Ruminococcus sp.]
MYDQHIMNMKYQRSLWKRYIFCSAAMTITILIFSPFIYFVFFFASALILEMMIFGTRLLHLEEKDKLLKEALGVADNHEFNDLLDNCIWLDKGVHLTSTHLISLYNMEAYSRFSISDVSAEKRRKFRYTQYRLRFMYNEQDTCVIFSSEKLLEEAADKLINTRVVLQ